MIDPSQFLQTEVDGQYMSPTHASIFLQTGVHGQCVTNSCQHILTDRGTWSMCHQLMSAYSYRQGYMVNVSPTHVSIFLQTGVHGQCITNSCQHILTDRGTWSMCHQLMSAYSYRQGYMVNVSPTHVSIFLQTGVHGQCVTNSCQRIPTEDRGTWSIHVTNSCQHILTDRST